MPSISPTVICLPAQADGKDDDGAKVILFEIATTSSVVGEKIHIGGQTEFEIELVDIEKHTCRCLKIPGLSWPNSGFVYY